METRLDRSYPMPMIKLSEHSIGVEAGAIKEIFGYNPPDGDRLVAGTKVWRVNGKADLGRYVVLSTEEFYEQVLTIRSLVLKHGDVP